MLLLRCSAVYQARVKRRCVFVNFLHSLFLTVNVGVCLQISFPSDPYHFSSCPSKAATSVRHHQLSCLTLISPYPAHTRPSDLSSSIRFLPSYHLDEEDQEPQHTCREMGESSIETSVIVCCLISHTSMNATEP